MEKRRKIECDVSDIDEEATNAIVRGIVMEVTPVKSSRKNPTNKYFHAKFSDGKKMVKIIAFDTKLHPKLTKAQESKASIEIINCQIKPASCSSVAFPEFELYINSYSDIKPIQKEFSLPADLKELDLDVVHTLTDLAEIETISVNQHVTVSGKVVQVEAATQIITKEGNSLTKQDCTISDPTKTVRVVLWSNDVGKLDNGQSYQFQNVNVKLYMRAKFLSVTTSSVITEIGDIGEVTTVNEDDLPPSDKELNGEIAGIASNEQYKKCISKSCPGKVKATSATAGKCMKCDSILKLSKCVDINVIELIVQDSSDNVHIVTANKDQVMKIVGTDSLDNLSDKLFSIGPIKITVNNKMIVTSIQLIDTQPC